VWGRRRIRSTTVVCGKGSSGFSIDDIEFEGSIIKDQFKKLQSDLKIGNKANNLTSILSNENFLVGCYQSIRSKPGNMTSSLDGINLEWFKEVSNSFKNGAFRFKPLRQTYIFKPNGDKRVLTIPSPRDKIVQEGIRILVSCVFEEGFKKSSHAFRPTKGCHTALNQIRMKCGKVNWFIEGYIKQQFPSIDRTILVETMRTKIQDEPFIDLIFKYIKVGYEEKSQTGISQGGLISPILSNIYMHPFDAWVEDELIPKYTKGKRKKSNPEYTKMIKKYGKAVAKSIRTTIAADENFVRVHYVRYADDFLIGIQGSKDLCKDIKK